MKSQWRMEILSYNFFLVLRKGEQVTYLGRRNEAVSHGMNFQVVLFSAIPAVRNNYAIKPKKN